MSFLTLLRFLSRFVYRGVKLLHEISFVLKSNTLSNNVIFQGGK